MHVTAVSQKKDRPQQHSGDASAKRSLARAFQTFTDAADSLERFYGQLQAEVLRLGKMLQGVCAEAFDLGAERHGVRTAAFDFRRALVSLGVFFLGDKGQRIKTIGARARAELEQMLERRIHLFLFVKVRENWIEDPERYAALGLDYNA